MRIGHFPTMTHLHALVARNMSRRGEGWFERYLPEQRIEWYLYSAGPSSMEALFGSTVDVTYVGPSPVINAYAASNGEEVRLIAGAVKGGAALVIAPGIDIDEPKDFKGLNIASPQLGNTQDITCRAWLTEHQLSWTLEGEGDVRISPTPKSMQAQLMSQGAIQASWTVEPWVTQLEESAHARIYINEPNACTTLLAARRAWLSRNPKLAQSLVRAHRELTEWIIANPEAAQLMVIDELEELTQSSIDPTLIRRAWSRLTLDSELDTAAIEKLALDSLSTGLIEKIPPIKGLFAPIKEDIPSSPIL